MQQQDAGDEVDLGRYLEKEEFCCSSPALDIKEEDESKKEEWKL